jgi:asparagine synthase (glutamine-hydrolysing)
MCGLVAIFNYNKVAPVDRDELYRIRESMFNRGPDGASCWISVCKQIGLAHRRLAIIDTTDSGIQPMASQDGSIHIVFNGEIYNYRALRNRLESDGYVFRSNSDTEVLINLYQKYGVDLVHQIRGMYSFVIWDGNKRGVLMGRDPFGIKPLYYADDGNTIRIASQVKALIAGGNIDTNPEPAGHVGFYLLGNIPEPFTIYKGIRSIIAGTTLWVDAAGKKTNREFFNLRAEITKAEEVGRDKLIGANLRDCLREAMLDSVRHHLISDVPVGAFLSAGLDSTTLVGLISDIGIKELRTVTLGFNEYIETRNDETQIAQSVSKHYNTEHYNHFVSEKDFAKELNNILTVMDQPSIDGINSYFVSKAAKAAGLKVIISGLGGDELFGGYSDFHQLPSIVRTFKSFSSVPWFNRSFRYISAPIIKYFTSVKYAGLFEYGGDYAGAYLLRRGLFMPWELTQVLDGDLVREGWRDLQLIDKLNNTVPYGHNSQLKVTSLVTAWYMRNQLLRDCDWASMAHSVEVRTPLVDVELFKMVIGLVGAGHTVTKLQMSQTPSKPLPNRVLNREKTGFTIPVREWMLAANKDPKVGLERGIRPFARFLMKQSLKSNP